MNRRLIYRRRRLTLALAVVAICVAGQHRRPVIGTLSIGIDPRAGLALRAEPAPTVRAARIAVDAMAGALRH